MAQASSGEAPLFIDDGGLRWARTDVRRGPDLVDGAAWIQEYQRQLQSQQTGGRRRVLRQTLTEGDDPRFLGGAAGVAPLPLRNEALRSMARLCADPERGPGRRVRLATGEEVIFWFNVGPGQSLRERVFVTESRCPHQGVCLLEGELQDIEDVSGAKRAMVRCPRHNKNFDLRTGESPGNIEVLKTFPCRFELGHWYVAVGDAPPPACGGGDESAMEVDCEAPSKKPRHEPHEHGRAVGLATHHAIEQVSRPLVQHMTIG